MLPAFDTPTGIPYGSINLRHGVAEGESTATCTAGAGTFLLEFTTLSKLTGNPAFEKAARRALHAVWERRSSIDLVGAHIDVVSGEWTHADSGVGTYIDSFYEYMLKSWILFGHQEDLHMFVESYRAVIRHLKRGPWYIEASMMSGDMTWPVFSSLQAFFPGMQVLFGDVEIAGDTLRAFMSLWQHFQFLPERYDLKGGKVDSRNPHYPLRPELAESLYYMFQATRDTEWAHFGTDMINSIEKHTRTACGYAAILNVSREGDAGTFERDDIMQSFFLSETLKYLYLIFDDNNWVTRGNYVFTTEAHPLPVSPRKWRRLHEIHTLFAVAKLSGR